MHRTRHILAAALAGVALAAAAGCSGDDDDTGRDDSVVETQTPAQPEDGVAAPGETGPRTRTTRTDTETTE